MASNLAVFSYNCVWYLSVQHNFDIAPFFKIVGNTARARFIFQELYAEASGTDDPGTYDLKQQIVERLEDLGE